MITPQSRQRFLWKFILLIFLIFSRQEDHNQSKIYIGNGEKYIQPKGLNFKQIESQKKDCNQDKLVKYFAAADSDDSLDVQLVKAIRDPLIKYVKLDKGELVITISFVDDCCYKYLGSYSVSNNSLNIEYDYQTDEYGNLIGCLCWCRYELEYHIENAKISETTEIIIQGKEIENFPKYDEILKTVIKIQST